MGQFLDRDIRFMLLAEGDARQFLPALARLGNKVVYMGDETVSASRLPTIRTVLRRSPIGSEIQERSNRELFRDLFEEGPGAVFVSPVRIGLSSGQNRSYGDDNWYRRYVETPLSRLPNKIVILNEVSLHKLHLDHKLMRQRRSRDPLYCVPHVHAIMCRSEAEARYCRAAYRNEVPVSLVGDMFLDEVTWPRRYKDRAETVAFLSSTHRMDVTGTIQRMLDDLEALIASGQRIARLVLKEHPGTESTDYRTLVRERCDRWRTELHACDKHQDLSDLQDTVDIALVQDSLTSHLALRRHGVESFLYRTGGGLGQDRDFFELAAHPDCTLGDKLSGHYTAEAYDAWTKATFALDGGAVGRFLDAAGAGTARAGSARV